MNQTVTGDHARRLAAVQGGCTSEQACALFDDLPVVVAEEITGRWEGSELPTGHPFDGLLTASGWYGKQFGDPETVHPLLFSGGGEVFAVDPRKMPLGLAGRVPLSVVAAGGKLINVLKPVLRTTQPRARLRHPEYRGKTSAAVIYDHWPVIDMFRRVDDHTLLGVMDQRDVDQPYFFVLQRD
jgi:hypothetical protein